MTHSRATPQAHALSRFHFLLDHHEFNLAFTDESVRALAAGIIGRPVLFNNATTWCAGCNEGFAEFTSVHSVSEDKSTRLLKARWRIVIRLAQASTCMKRRWGTRRICRVGGSWHQLRRYLEVAGSSSEMRCSRCALRTIASIMSQVNGNACVSVYRHTRDLQLAE